MSDHSELKKAAEDLAKENTCAAANKFEELATPAAVLALIAEVEGLRNGWYSDECDNLRFWPEELSESKQEVDRLEAEVEALRSILSEARSMLNTVSECSSNECEDCREHAGLHRDGIDSVIGKSGES